MGGDDNFEQGVRTDFKKKVVEQMLAGGAMLTPGGGVFMQREE